MDLREHKRSIFPTTLMLRTIIALAIVVMGVTGCQPVVRASISSFSELPKILTGKKIHLLAYPPEKNTTLEWKSYRQKFKNDFKKARLAISEIESADCVAFISYGIDGGKVTQELVRGLSDVSIHETSCGI
jgi:hypothetical protein